MTTRKRRSDPQRDLLATHARACAVERSWPTPANHHPPPIGTDRRPFTIPAARAVTLARACRSPRPLSRVSLSLNLSGTVRISGWRYVAYLRSYLQIATGSRLDWPKPTHCSNWPVACSLRGYFRIFPFLMCICLPLLSVCRHSLRSLVIGRYIDNCPRL